MAALIKQETGVEPELVPGGRGEFTVDLTDVAVTFSVEWLNVYTGTTVAGKPVRGGGVTIFSTPFGGPAVLYLKAAGNTP